MIAAASIADFGAVILLSLFFSGEATGPGAQLLLIGGLVLLAVGVGATLTRAGRWRRLSEDLGRLQDTSAQIRVRGAVLLLAVFVWLAQQLGLEAILGAFLAGALLRVVDQNAAMTHPRFRAKLEALGFGMFVPIFFVVSGVQFDLVALTTDASALTMVPLFLVSLVLVRGLPALLYRHRVGTHRTLVAALLQATSLPFIVAAAQIGMELGKLSPAASAALVAAGLLSVVLFPLSALSLLRAHEDQAEEPTPADEASTPAVRPRGSRAATEEDRRR